MGSLRFKNIRASNHKRLRGPGIIRPIALRMTRFTNGMPCGSNVAIFIRSILGIDRKNAVRMFSEFISGNELNADQEDFLMTIISYVCENGDITKEIVVNEAPFDERLAVFTPYMLPLAKYIDTIHTVIIPHTA